jgi:hypothetical protein
MTTADTCFRAQVSVLETERANVRSERLRREAVEERLERTERRLAEMRLDVADRVEKALL